MEVLSAGLDLVTACDVREVVSHRPGLLSQVQRFECFLADRISLQRNLRRLDHLNVSRGDVVESGLQLVDQLAEYFREVREPRRAFELLGTRPGRVQCRAPRAAAGRGVGIRLPKPPDVCAGSESR